jgi:hypothetical protein
VRNLDGCDCGVVAILLGQSLGFRADADASHNRVGESGRNRVRSLDSCCAIAILLGQSLCFRANGTGQDNGVRNLDSRGIAVLLVAVLLGQGLRLCAYASHNRIRDDSRDRVRNLKSCSSVLLGESQSFSADADRGRVGDSDRLEDSSSVSRSRVQSGGRVAESESLGLNVRGGHGLRGHNRPLGLRSGSRGLNIKRIDPSGAVLVRRAGGRRRGNSRRVDDSDVFVRRAGGHRRGNRRRVDDRAVLKHARGRRRGDCRSIGKGAVLVRRAGGVRWGHNTARGSESSRSISRSGATESRAHVDGVVVLDELANLILEVTDA